MYHKIYKTNLNIKFKRYFPFFGNISQLYYWQKNYTPLKYLLKKISNRFKISEYKPVLISINPRVANFLLFYNKNTDKITIK